MRVKLLESCATLRQVNGMGAVAAGHNPGSEMEVSEEDGQRMIEFGKAVAVEAKPTAAATKR